MAHLTLIFSGDSKRELAELRFTHPFLGRECRSFRGKDSGVHRSSGSFQLSAAVIALCELALRTKISSLIPGYEAFLQGERGSSAASLEQAINKPPRWLEEMFGCDTFGNSLCRRLFDRTNPGMKRAGPVALRFRDTQLNGEQIQIVCGDQQIQGPGELRCLLESLKVNPKDETDADASLAKFLAPIYVDETVRMLRLTEVFSRDKIRAELDTIYANPSFQILAGDSGRKLEALVSEPRMRDRLGLRAGRPAVEAPIRIALGGNNGATLALIHHVQKLGTVPIEIDYEFPYAVPLVNDLICERLSVMPDVCVTGVAPAAKLLRDKSREYVPVLLAPRMTNRVVAKDRSRSLSSGVFHIVEEPTTGSFYFDELQRTQKIRRSAIDVRYIEPDESFEALQHGDSRSVLWFPHYHIVRRGLNGVFLDENIPGSCDQACIFFFHRRFADTPAAFALESAIRRAWLDLRKGGPALEQTVAQILSEPRYLQFIARTSGLSR